MWNLRYTRPSGLAGVIHVSQMVSGLGTLIDVDGVRWHVRQIFSRDGLTVVSACREDELHPYYTDTSMRGHGVVSQIWEPYGVVVAPAADRDDGQGG